MYHPFPDSNAIWIGTDKSYDGADCWIYNNYNLYISGDTTIGIYAYHKLFRSGYMYSNCPPPGYYYYDQYYGVFRQDIINKKIYINVNGVDTIAYDFNLNVGDTLPPTYLNWYASNNFVESIDSVFVGNDYRKRFWISNNYSSPNFIALIEGIGSEHGAFALFLENWIEAKEELWCIYENDEVAWSYFPSGAFCTLITATNKQISENDKLSIYPNPFKTSTQICLDKVYANLLLTIYNTFGQKVKEINSSNNQIITIMRESLISGIYILQIKENDKLIITKKIMVQD